jgi:hypothetical protein
MDLKEAEQQKNGKLHNEEHHNCYASSAIISLGLLDKGGCDGRGMLRTGLKRNA